MKLHRLVGIALLSCCFSACDTSQAPDTKSDGLSAELGEVRVNKALDAQDLESLKQDYANTPFKVLHIGLGEYDHGPALFISLSTPIDPSQRWHNAISVSDKQGKALEGEWIVGESLNALYFPFIEAEKEYSVRVAKNLANINGRIIENPSEQKVRTRAIESALNFVHHGSQLSPQLADGLSVEAVNVDAVDVDFFRVNDDKVAQFFASDHSGNRYYLQRLSSLMTLAHSARFDLNFEKNKRLKSVLPLKDIAALKKPGIYFTVMKGAGHYPRRHETSWFSISDIGLQMRRYESGYAAFVHDVESVQPAENVQIQLFDSNSKLIEAHSSDVNGFANFSSTSANARYAIAASQGSYAVLPLTRPNLDLSEYSLPTRTQHPVELFLFAPRDLYRPGEEVIINALMRDHDGRLLGAAPINVVIETPDSRTHKSFTWQGDASAFYSHTFTLPKQAMRGQWRFIARLGNKTSFEYAFSVEDFLPERMKLLLSEGEGDRSVLKSIKVQGDYLYGAPAAGNRIEARVRSRQARSASGKWKDFVFGFEKYTEFDKDIKLESKKLNEQGYTEFSLGEQWSGARAPMHINTEVSLYESGGRPVTRSLKQIVWPSETLVGLRPQWEAEYASPNNLAQIELIHIDKKDTLRASEALDVTVWREDYQYYWRWRRHWESASQVKEIPIFNRVLSFKPDEREQIAIPVEYGNYRVEIKNRRGDLLTSYRFFAGWHWDKPEQGASGRPDQITMTWDKNHYRGDSDATLNVRSPYAGRALITVEADALLWQKQIDVEVGDNSVSIPISKNWQRHDIFTSVTVLRKGAAKQKYMPKRAFGILHLPLDRNDRKLTVHLDTPKKVKPESLYRVNIKVDAVKAQKIQLTLAAVDTGVLSISNFKTPDAWRWFFAPRRYQHEIRDTWSHFIEQLSERSAKIRFGGDAEALSRGGEAPASDIQIVSLFSGKVELNEQGEAQVEFQLPYFNGELRLMAQAWSNDAFGQAEEYVTVAAPMIAEINMPRFMAKGDKSYASFDVQNLTDTQQEIRVELNADESLGGESESIALSLAPKAREILSLPLHAKSNQGRGLISLALHGQSSEIALQRKWHLGLRPPYAAQTKKWEMMIPAGQEFALPKDFRSKWDSEQSQLAVSVSPYPPLNMSEHLEGLFQYPYGCLEQTTSRAWPFIISSDEKIKALSSHRPKPLNKNRHELMEQAIGRISSMQLSHGGFGLWSNRSPEVHWLSVYASEFLFAAQDAGFNVDKKVIDKALSRLKHYVKTRRVLWSEKQHYSALRTHYHFSYRAYAAKVLADKQQLSLGDARNLYDKHAQFAATRLSLTHIAHALELGGDEKRATEAWKKAFEKREWPHRYTGDYNTPLRDIALSINLALQSRIATAPLSHIFELRDAMLDRRWFSTQERWALYALGQNLEKSNQQKPWDLVLDSDTENGKHTGTYTQAFSTLWRNNATPGSLNIKNNNALPLYVDISLAAYPKTTPNTVSEGITVRRTYYNEKGQEQDLKNIESGDLVLVRLDVSATGKQRIPDALVIDFLPSGFEIENQNLASAVDMSQMKVEGRSIQAWLQDARIVHEESRDDRYVAAISLDSRWTSLFYLVRAVSLGEFILPATLVEDMYRPWFRAVGDVSDRKTINIRKP